MRRLVLLAIALVPAGCGSDEPAAPAPPGPPRLETGNALLPIAGFNHRAAASDEPWTRSPVLAAGEFLRLDSTSAQRTSVVARSGPEGRGPTHVVVELVGLSDDSIRALRYVLAFTQQADGTWRLRAARWSQRCNPGRGHQAFAPLQCV